MGCHKSSKPAGERGGHDHHLCMSCAFHYVDPDRVDSACFPCFDDDDQTVPGRKTECRWMPKDKDDWGLREWALFKKWS